MVATVTESEYFTFDDVIECKKAGGAGLKLKKYDPYIFWNGMGERWFQQFNQREKLAVNVAWIIDRLKQFEIDNLLDAGTGFGRVLPFLIESGSIKKGTGIELSPEILKCSQFYLEPARSNDEAAKVLAIINSPETPDLAKRELKELYDKMKADSEAKAKLPDYRDRITLQQGDVRKIEFPDNSFDAVLSSEVIQHLPPDEAKQACNELYRVAKKVVILLERWSFPSEHSEPHIWSHNIAEIYKNLGITTNQVTTANHGIQGVVIIKN